MRFVLDEKLPQNASKFAILLEYENLCSFFRFSFRVSLMNALVYVDISRHIPKVWQILKRFVGAFHQAQTSYFRRVARLDKEEEEIQMNNSLIGNPGFSQINQQIISYLDHKSQMAFRSVCQSWKAQVDEPHFWIKKLDSKGQSKNFRKAWIDLVGRIPKGSDLEKEVTECLMK